MTSKEVPGKTGSPRIRFPSCSSRPVISLLAIHLHLLFHGEGVRRIRREPERPAGRSKHPFRSDLRSDEEASHRN